jgi:serine/threonine protein kinase
MTGDDDEEETDSEREGGTPRRERDGGECERERGVAYSHRFIRAVKRKLRSNNLSGQTAHCKFPNVRVAMGVEEYRVIQKIGKGSYGAAFLAQKKSNPAVHVVVKKVSLQLLRREEVEESVQEAQVLSMLDHPCIIKHIEHFVVR